MNRAIAQFALLVMIAAAAATAAGCSSTYRKPATGMEGAQAKFDLPAKELLARIKQALNEPPLNIGVT